MLRLSKALHFIEALTSLLGPCPGDIGEIDRLGTFCVSTTLALISSHHELCDVSNSLTFGTLLVSWGSCLCTLYLLYLAQRCISLMLYQSR